ncbi:alcohol dehydrogenase [Pseudorhizobium endolithicum]|uniref:Alcohol dehydrogenase n=1 Tax=Pseudorhizobium endolithicum TaxID=1191678 RepID=A0ABM8PLI8_9HYPH|nr:cytochrome c [Pseudorhizobium endolithicum]CAD7036532.1 alcohol dehydrogenase [Pseudorhizobium endolithicum]
MTKTPFAIAATLVLTIAPASSSGHAQENSFAQVERGRYAVATGNCQGCHTIPGEAPFSGGRGLETPFGTIYTPNITFEAETGLGEWSKDDFWQAMHNGVGRDGSHLYPAFPYPHFTKMPRAEVDAIYDYLATIPRVRREKPENDLPFPLNQRMALLGWKWMFFEPGEYQENPDKSPEWNRGAYLVEGPGHCAGCHTPKNLAGADKKDQNLQGGVLENWSAPSIRAGRNGALADWSEDDIVEFLRAGRNRHTAAFSTMAEVIELSTQHMTDRDLRAIAIYLKDREGDGERKEADAPDEVVVTAGEAIYFDNCSACHTSDGSGIPRFFAPLAGSGKVNNEDATTVIRVILEGARSVPTKTHPSPLSMPAFDWKLTDEQIAAVVSYIRSSWGNQAGAVTADQVADLREALKD